MAELLVRVFEVVGGDLCVASEDGQRVHDQIAAGLRGGHQVTLSFQNVSVLTSAFLNAAIGQLYGAFNETDIRRSLRVIDMSPEDLELLKRVVETAKQYFKDPQGFDRAVRRGLGEEDDAGGD